MDSHPNQPPTWQESLSHLKQLLSEQSGHSKIEKLCSTILTNDAQDLPHDVKDIITTIYLRALISTGKFANVYNYHSSQTGAESSNVLEGAYALYRLRKYESCRSLCCRYLEQNDDAARSNFEYRGIMHIYAQSLYRMGITQKADEVYSKLVNGAADMDVDEKEDVLANVLANKCANYTPGSFLSRNSNGEGMGVWVENVDEVKDLLETYGTTDGPDEDILQNYDLAYNLATFLLVSSDARPRSSIVQAKQLLVNAEKSALTVLDSSTDVQDLDEEAAAKKKQAQTQLAEKEAMPIQANLAYANILLGGEANEKDALRTYLTFVMEANRKTTKNNANGASVGVEANLLAASSNNLALLRDGKESVFDVLKRIPVAASGSTEEKSGKGNKGVATTCVSSIPLAGATPQQVRTVLFNRALQLAKMGNVSGCLEALAVLRASLNISYHGDEAESEGNRTPGSPKTRGKKKKSVGKSDSGEISLDQQDVPTAMPSSEFEAIAWKARIDWVESELRRSVPSDDKKPEDIIKSAISCLDLSTKCDAKSEAAGALDFMKAQLLLQNTAVAGQTKPQPIIATLESLPPLIKSCPGTTVTLASLHGTLHQEDSTTRSLEIMSSLGNGIPARIAMAEFHMERNHYDEAIKLLEGILDDEASATTDQIMTATALLVKTLSYTDPEKAFDYAETLGEACGDETEVDGEELEKMEIPRFAKKVLGYGGDSDVTSSKVRKMIASTGAKRGATRRVGQGNKKNREAILRKRAKQREAYLKQLESKGLYDPNKPSKPDPERWIPKSQRSYNRRGRRGRYNSNIGAQGGGAGAGMEKDAQKLDVAARVAAAKSGAANGSDGRLSTANMQVSGSGPSRKGKGGKRR